MQLNDIKSIMAGTMIPAEKSVNRIISDEGRSSDRLDVSELRNISIKNPTYQKDDISKDQNLFDQAMRDQDSGSSAFELKNRMVLASEGMTDEEYAAMKEKDHSPMDMEAGEFETIADEIRAQLEKGGVDVAMTKAAALSDISKPGAMYLINNNLEPTIDNVFKAEFSTGDGIQADTTINRMDIKVDVNAYEEKAIDLSTPEMELMLHQIESVIAEAGLEVNEDVLSEAATLVGNDIPLTKESIGYFDMLLNEPLLLEEDQVKTAIDNSIAEGRSAGEAYLLPGYSLHDQAAKLYEEVQNMTIDASDVTAARQLNEARLMMTMEASFSLLKTGVMVDTSDLAKLVEDLKLVEDKLSQKADIRHVMDTIDEFSEMPVSLLGDNFEKIDDLSLNALYESGRAAMEKQLSAEGTRSENEDGPSDKKEPFDYEKAYIRAAGRYETMATEVRPDLGDSIKKAFQNVDDILTEIGMETTPANERAVRILGYNRLEINEKSVEEVKYADQKVQQTIKTLTPGVVTELIRRGENPLDLSLSELDGKIKNIKEEIPAVSTDEKFSEFLWKMDQTGGITPEQRESFIGVFRLIHQVEQTDGAIIGQMMAAGMDVTLRNMMTAVRSRKNEGREYTVDDDFGGINAVDVGKLSITEQIEAGFMYSRLRDAGNEMTPELMMQFDSEDTYMNMDPDRFATALEEMDKTPDEKLEEKLAKEELFRMQQALTSEERIYQILSDMDAPVTPANLEAWAAYMADRNSPFKMLNKAMNSRDGKPFSQTTNELDIDDPEGALSDVMADIIEAFGEAAKTPVEMAEAQEKLAETAESVMRNMIVERETGHIDIRGMRIAMKQMTLLGDAARHTEQYAVPIMVADEMGNMTLKIVRGREEEKGQVDVALDMESTGAVRAGFKIDGDVITGNIRVAEKFMEDKIADNLSTLSLQLSEAVNMPVELSVTHEGYVDANGIYTDRPDFETTTLRREVQTKRLYAMARSFIQGFGKIVS